MRYFINNHGSIVWQVTSTNTYYTIYPNSDSPVWYIAGTAWKDPWSDKQVPSLYIILRGLP